jgi:hypothetical protein
MDSRTWGTLTKVQHAALVEFLHRFVAQIQTTELTLPTASELPK